MERSLKLGAWALTLAGASWLLGWADGFHLLGGGGLLAIALLARLGWRRWRSSPDDWYPDEAETVYPLRAAAGGFVLALGTLVYLGVGLWALQKIDVVYGGFHDRDRGALEAKVQTLEEAGDYEQAAALLRARIERPMTAVWQKELAANLYRDLVKAGQRCRDLKARSDHFREARGVAQAHGVDDQLAVTLLAQADRDLGLAQRMESLRAEQKWSELVSDLRSEIKQRPQDDTHALAEWLFDSLVEWGRSSTDLPERARHFREALEVAQGHGLKREPASSLLAAAEAELSQWASLERQVRQFREQKQWQQLVRILRLNAETRPRPEWRHPLDQWLYDALCRQGDDTTDWQEKQACYQEALATARKFQLDEGPASARVQRVEAELGRRDVLDWLSKVMVSWGDQEAEPSAKVALYRGAVEVSKKYGLESAAATSRLRAVEVALTERRRLGEEKARPAPLPRGARAGLVSVVDSGYPPVLILGVWVEDADGKPVLGLKEKDFAVLVDGKPGRVVALAPVRQDTPLLSLALVLDISGSMGGVPLTETKNGARALLAGLKGSKATVTILAFNGRVQRCCNWTEDLGAAASHLERLTAEGETALFNAVAAALDDLRSRKGQRRLVLFTDGKDTVGGTDLTTVIERCKKEGVPAHVIGLRSQDLDADTLRRLAQETGGEYVEAVRPEELVERFRLTSQRIRGGYYRLVIAPGDVSGEPPGLRLEVRVGGANGVTLRSATPRP